VEELQKTKLEQQRDTGSMNMVPVISMGRDDRAWGGTAGYYSTAAEFESTARWLKDTLVPSLPGGSPGRKMVLLDNWNEYGEGHVMMPAGLNGFGYLDALRSVFTTGGAHADAQPTAAQKQRIGVLYPEGRVLPSRVKPAPPITNTYSAVWDFNSDGD